MQRNVALVRKKYLEYLGSTLAYSLSLYVANIVDAILVGQLLGPMHLTAINLTMPVVYVKNIVLMLFINGGSTIAAQYLGERRKSDVNRIFTLSFLGCITADLALLLIGTALSSPITDLLTLNGSGREYVLAYLIPLFAAGPVQAVTNGASAFVRLDGRHRLAAALPFVANTINLICDYIFIRFFHWGIAGAGWATVTGYACGMLLLIPYFRDKTRNLHIVPIKAADLKMLPQCFRVGLPMALIQSGNVLRNYIINSVVLAHLGDIGSQVISVCNNALFYAIMFAEGVATAMSSICGTLFGEKDMSGVRSVLKRSLQLGLAICVALFLLLELFPVQFGRFYNITEPETQAMLARYLRIFVIYLPFLAPVFVLRSFYQATKHTNEATAISLLEGAVITIPVFLVLSALSTDLMWLGNCLGAVITLALVLIVMQRRASREGADNFLLLREEDPGRSHEFSMDASLEGAEKASRETISFLRSCGVSDKVANALGVAAEELCVNVAHYAGVPAQEQIDAFLRVLDDRVLLKVRDSGVPFNPTEFIGETGEHITGLSLIRAMGCEIEYDRIIGFNTTIITAPRPN